MFTTSQHGAIGEAGFTLLEVLVVLAIAGLIAGIAFPRLERLGEQIRFVQARNELLGAALRARAEAIRSDTDVQLDAQGSQLLLNGRTVAELPPGAEARSAAPLRFYADGSGSGGAMDVALGRQSAQLLSQPVTGALRWRS